MPRDSDRPAKGEDRYDAPAEPASEEIRERGSRFIACLRPCGSLEAGAEELESIRKRYHGATHHCWACRVGWSGTLLERWSDDGEPHHTAGEPILKAMAQSGISDGILVVVRYFGGIKLGVGGLARAYRRAAASVLETGPRAARTITRSFAVRVPFPAQGALRRLLEPYGASIAGEAYGEDWHVTIEVPAGSGAVFEGELERLREKTGGEVTWKSK